MSKKRCNKKNLGLYRFHVQAPRFLKVKIDFAYDNTLKNFFWIKMISNAFIYIFLEFFMFLLPVAKMIQRKKCWKHVKTVYLAIWNRLNDQFKSIYMTNFISYHMIHMTFLKPLILHFWNNFHCFNLKGTLSLLFKGSSGCLYMYIHQWIRICMTRYDSYETLDL